MQVNTFRSRIGDLVGDITGNGPLRTAHLLRRNQIALGIAAAIGCVIALVVTGFLYLVPVGYHDYRANLTNASGLRTGDQVRIAGISVGEVGGIKIEGDHVTVTFSVKDGVAIGDQTALAVKLLTPVGGRFMMLSPKGDQPLGNKHIPVDRTSGTYDMASIFEAATPILADVDGRTLRATIEEINDGLAGQPDAIGRITDNSASLISAIETRSQQLRTAMHVSDEYVGATVADRQVLLEVVRNLGTIGVKLASKRDQVIRVFNLLKRFFAVIHRPVMAFETALEKPISDAWDIFLKLESHLNQVDTTITDIGQFVNKVGQVTGTGGLTIDQSATTVHGVELCVPRPGVTC